jgi:hypothetical protein
MSADATLETKRWRGFFVAAQTVYMAAHALDMSLAHFLFEVCVAITARLF